jgi:hypothetical protein
MNFNHRPIFAHNNVYSLGKGKMTTNGAGFRAIVGKNEDSDVISETPFVRTFRNSDGTIVTRPKTGSVAGIQSLSTAYSTPNLAISYNSPVSTAGFESLSVGTPTPSLTYSTGSGVGLPRSKIPLSLSNKKSRNNIKLIL